MKTHYRLLLLVFIIWSFSSGVYAQNWSHIHGSNRPASIVLDSNNKIWVTYGDGIVSIDSSGFQVYSQPLIWSTSVVDNLGNIWIAAYSGFLYKFDGVNWTKYPTPNGLFGVICITISNSGVVWIGTVAYGLVRFENGNWSNYDNYWTPTGAYNFPNVNTIAVDTSNTIYFSSDTELFTINEDASSINRVDDSITNINSKIYVMVFEDSGKKWFGTYSDGLICLDNDSVFQYNNSNSPIGDHVSGISMSKSGALFVCSSNGLIKKEGAIYNAINTIPSISYVQGMQIDSNDVLWFINSEGLFSVDSIYIDSFPRIIGPRLYNINAIEFDNQANVWVGAYYNNYSTSHISIYDGSNWTYLNYGNSGLSVSGVKCIKADKIGNIWIGNKYSLIKYDGASFTNRFFTNFGMSQLGVNDIAVDSNNTKWFATYEGVRVFDDTNWTIYSTANGLYNNEVLTVFVDNQDNKWFGTSNGIAKFDGANWTIDTINGISNLGIITAISQDNNGDMWFGTSNATVNSSNWIYKYDGIQWWTFAATDNVNQIYIDDEGNKWFIEGDGVSVLNKYGWIHYNSRTDLLFTEPRCIVKAPDNKLWIGCFEGISIFDGNPLGISESKIDEDNTSLIIYPNPTSRMLNIKSKNEISSIEIYDFNGRLLISQVVGGKEVKVSLEVLPKGVYLIRVIGQEISFMRKVVKN